MADNWEFHFRNFDPGEDWFGVYHAGCSGLGEDWHDGRPNCWGRICHTTPQGVRIAMEIHFQFTSPLASW